MLESRKRTSAPYVGDLPVTELEERFAAYHDAKYGVATSSGTAALQIAFAAAGVREGDEVIVAPNTFTAGEGGIVLTNDEETAERASLHHNIGRVVGRPGYEHHVLASNYRLTEMQAAVLLAQLKEINRWVFCGLSG